MRKQNIVLKELIKKEIKSQLKEDFIDRWLDKLFDSALDFRTKNDPVIQKIKDDAADTLKKSKDMIIKKYGSLENAPEFYRTVLKDK